EARAASNCGHVEAERPHLVVAEPLAELHAGHSTSSELDAAHAAGGSSPDDLQLAAAAEDALQLVGAQLERPAGGGSGLAVAVHAPEIREVAAQRGQPGLGPPLAGGVEVGLDGGQLPGQDLAGGGLGGSAGAGILPVQTAIHLGEHAAPQMYRL